MIISARIHVETDLNLRLESIMEEYDYIVRDESNIQEMITKIENYNGKQPEETWKQLAERYISFLLEKI